jgi:pyrroline-5-carboxylate reductase
VSLRGAKGDEAIFLNRGLMKKNTIGIIGGGNMGEALIKGLLREKRYNIRVCEANPARVSILKGRYKVSYEKNIRSLISKANIIILAVKPQDMHAPLSWFRDDDSIEDKLFISIAAGLTTKFFEKNLPGKPHVVRAMPNLPSSIGESATAICKGRFATDGDANIAGSILGYISGTIGTVIKVEEKYMDAVTAVSGSGPAYVFLFVEYWIAAAISLGLSENDAKELVWVTLIGSAHLVRNFDARELRERVTSKGGTTEAAMKVFEKNNFGKLMKDALTAAKNRSKELAK